MLHLFFGRFRWEFNKTLYQELLKPLPGQCGKCLQMLQDCKKYDSIIKYSIVPYNFSKSPNVAGMSPNVAKTSPNVDKLSPNVAFYGNNIK